MFAALDLFFNALLQTWTVGHYDFHEDSVDLENRERPDSSNALTDTLLVWGYFDPWKYFCCRWNLSDTYPQFYTGITNMENVISLTRSSLPPKLLLPLDLLQLFVTINIIYCDVFFVMQCNKWQKCFNIVIQIFRLILCLSKYSGCQMFKNQKALENAFLIVC